MSNQEQKAKAFRAFHQGAPVLLLPNAWNAGSARFLENAGFSAIGTTSAGIAFSLGLPDGGLIGRDEMIDQVGRIVEAVEVPVSADIENGYGPGPEDVAVTVSAAIAAGAVGGNVEDSTGEKDAPLYEMARALDRLRAARAAGDASPVAFTLNARADPFLIGHSDAFAESVRRANEYLSAGADCVFVPGVNDADTIGALVREIDGPLNVLAGGSPAQPNVAELEALGVRRISIGSSLANATFALMHAAASEMRGTGTFSFAADAVPHAEMNALMARKEPAGD